MDTRSTLSSGVGRLHCRLFVLVPLFPGGMKEHQTVPLNETLVDPGEKRDFFSRYPVSILYDHRKAGQNKKVTLGHIDRLPRISDAVAFLDIHMADRNHGLNLLGFLPGMHIVHQRGSPGRRDKKNVEGVRLQNQIFFDQMHMPDKMNFILDVFRQHPVGIDHRRGWRFAPRDPAEKYLQDQEKNSSREEKRKTTSSWPGPSTY